MASVFLKKLPNGFLQAASNEDYEKLTKLKIGEVVRADVVKPRNYRFLQKFFELIKLAFTIWAETLPKSKEYRGTAVMPNIERFREDVTILAGHYEATFAVNGETRLRAKSISFSRMNEEDFERLYNDVLTVILEKVIPNQGYTADQIDNWVNQALEFA